MDDTNIWLARVTFYYLTQTSHCVIFIHLLLMTWDTWKLLPLVIYLKVNCVKDALRCFLLGQPCLWENNFWILSLQIIPCQALDFLRISKRNSKNSLLSILGFIFFSSLIALRNLVCASTFTVIVLYSFLGNDIVWISRILISCDTKF